jgi:hypothetical protein
MFPRPVQVKALQKYEIWLKYSDNTEGQLDLSHLAGKPAFSEWIDSELFFKVYIDPETHAIAWNCDIELCPDSLYLKLKGITFEEWKDKDPNWLCRARLCLGSKFKVQNSKKEDPSKLLRPIQKRMVGRSSASSVRFVF